MVAEPDAQDLVAVAVRIEVEVVDLHKGEGLSCDGEARSGYNHTRQRSQRQ